MDIRNPTVGRRALDLWFDRIRPEYHDLIRELERTGRRLTLADLKDMRGNSWEWAALRGFFDDWALAGFLEYTAVNAGVAHRSPPIVYDDTLANVFAPLAAQRILELSRLASQREAVLASVSDALVVAGFVHEAEGRDPAPPRLTEIPRCVRDLADGARMAREESERHEAALVGFFDFVTENWRAVEFWGLGKRAPESWLRNGRPLRYDRDTAGPRGYLAWTVGHGSTTPSHVGGWVAQVPGVEGGERRENILAPWYDPPFEWALGLEPA